MRRPLRSKRAITSPLRARSKASGLTRIRVRLTAGGPLLSIGFRSLLLLLLRSGRRWCLLLARGRLAALRGPFAARPLALAAQRFLAVGAERPARVDRFATARAGGLEAALALRAAHVVPVDRELAAGAGGLGQLADPQLRRLDLQLALVGVLKELRRAHDRVNGGAEVGNEGGEGRATDQEGVGDTALGVEGRVDDQGQPDDDQHQDEEVDDQIEAAVADAEYRCSHGWGARERRGGQSTSPPRPRTLLEEEAAEEVAEAKEDQDLRGDDRVDQSHHREQFRAGAFRARLVHDRQSSHSPRAIRAGVRA